MSHEYGPSAPLHYVVKCAESPVNPVGVSYLSGLDYVMVEPHQYDLAVDGGILYQWKPRIQVTHTIPPSDIS